MPRIIEPLINGHRYSFSSIELVTADLVVTGVRRIAYGSSLRPGVIYGTDARKIGRTEGQAEHRCSLDLYRHEAEILIDSLGPGFGLQTFDVLVQFAEMEKYERDGQGLPEGVTTDRVIGCRITDVELDCEDSPEPLLSRLTLDPMTVAYGRRARTIEWTTFSSPTTVEIR